MPVFALWTFATDFETICRIDYRTLERCMVGIHILIYASVIFPFNPCVALRHVHSLGICMSATKILNDYWRVRGGPISSGEPNVAGAA